MDIRRSSRPKVELNSIRPSCGRLVSAISIFDMIFNLDTSAVCISLGSD